MNALIWLAVAITSEVIATTALKASEGFSRPGPSVIVFGETFPLAKAGGIALIVAGVVMLNLPAARG
ncbi:MULTISPECIES: SMR family transporter [unclassified Halomonas]|uniref:SMR family transporter n=1 Tax=unclassified Halomonas TaxID=2609666 RepID=UPI0024684FB9|nr:MULTISPECIES: SMR family transporter [unclassified Halomonas]